MKILVCTYIPAEYFPPTLNAVEMLSPKAKEIIILTRNLKTFPWLYPDNVKVVRIGENISIKDSEHSSIVSKIKQFLSYYNSFRKLVKSFNPDIVLLYDTIPLLAVTIGLKTGLKKPPLLWYHNHDVVDQKKLRKYSIGWLASKYESAIFNKLDLFTLPSKERMKYFPIQKLRGKWLVINNYPLKKRYSNRTGIKEIEEKTIKLLYQGYIGEGHALEDMMEILGLSVEGKQIELTVIGLYNDWYKNKLLDLAKTKGVEEYFSILDSVSYETLPNITLNHDIGLAIHKPVNVNFETAGLASNKIFEYAALGLPVIVFDNEHYRSVLSRFKWIYFTDCSKNSLLQQIMMIVDNYQSSSLDAKASFDQECNFEIGFKEINSILL